MKHKLPDIKTVTIAADYARIADRHFAQGNYSKAVEHYAYSVMTDPGNLANRSALNEAAQHHLNVLRSRCNQQQWGLGA